jgi:hypothetical protein
MSLSLCTLQHSQAQDTTNGMTPYFSPLLIDSPENATYTTNKVCLNTTIATMLNIKQVNVTIAYSLDDNNNVTIPTTAIFVPFEYIDENGDTKVSGIFSRYDISGVVELENLQQGSHSLAVYVWYEIDIVPVRTGFDSQTVYFTIDDGSTQGIANTDIANSGSESPYTVYAFAGIISLVVVVSFALFTKRNQSGNTCEITTAVP